MTEPMTDERRADIRARMQAAPIGPWVAERGYPQVVHNGGEDILAEFHQDIDEEPTAAVFAAAARQDVADLLDENAQLREALQEVKLRTVQRDLSRLAHTALYGTKKGETRG